MQTVGAGKVMLSRLVKGASIQSVYDGDDFVKNRLTVVATFSTIQGRHSLRMQFAIQMIDQLSEQDLINLIVNKINSSVQEDIFGRAFRMVRRLMRIKS